MPPGDDGLTYVTYETARPKGDFPGSVEEGWFCVEDNSVVLYDTSKARVDKLELIPHLTPRQQAAIMLKRRAGMRNTDFNRRLSYPKGF